MDPILLDRTMYNLYSTMDQFWKDETVEGGVLEDVALVSISGGFRDTLVRGDLCQVCLLPNSKIKEDILPPSHGFSIDSTAVPTIGISVDHQVFHVLMA